MDYHDNDYEDQNLHLAGEESSKISSVLPPFALPKFDFDDNLHGHLRFDSLVENEVFLGIPGQVDNQWIEDFSRGSGGIVFSSSATESCALPRHDNVWSEATSSESVEMLLKAVGREEMVTSENVVEESNPVEQLGSSTEQTELKMKQDACMDEAEDKKSVLLVAEAERDIYRLGETTDVPSVHTECMLQARETKLPSYEECNSQESSLLVTAEKLHTDVKFDCSFGELGVLLSNEPLSKQAEVIFSTGFDISERSSQMNSISIEQADVQDGINDKGFASTNFVAVSVLELAEDNKESYNTSDEAMEGIDVENGDMDMQKPIEIPAKLECAEGHEAEIEVEYPNLHEKGESLSSLEGLQEVAFDFESLGASEGENMVFSSTHIMKPSEACDSLPEKLSTGAKGSHMDGLGDLAVSFSGEICIAETVVKDARDVGVSPTTQEDLTHHPLLLEDNRTVREDIPSLHGDVCEHNLDASKFEDEDNKVPLNSAFIDLDDEERELGSTFSGPVAKVDVDPAAVESDLDAPSRDYPVLESEAKDTVSTSSCAQEDTLSESREHDTPSDGSANKDQSKDTEFEAIAELSLVQEEPCEVLVNETEKDTLSDTAVARGPQIADKFSFSSETSSGAIFDEADQEVTEKAMHPANEMFMQDNVAETTRLQKPEKVEVERSSSANIMQVPATVSAVETDGTSIGNFSLTSLNPGVNSLSKEEGTFTFVIRNLGTRSIGGSDTSLPSIPIIQACNSSATGEGSRSAAGNNVDPVTTKEVSHSSSLILDGKSPSEDLKGSNQRKSKRGSSKTVKDNAKKGNQMKETTPLRQTERGDKSRGPLSPLIGGQIMKFESILQPRGAISTPTSSLPDLNSSTPAFFQQPFTDLQQVQLRAQIFVYGSLIQGVAPDEACMVSAFDGGHSNWELIWRASVERFHGQKSLGISLETPLQSRTGGKASDQLNRQSFPKSEVLSALGGRPASPMIPLSSPLWNLSTPSSDALPSSNMPRSSVFDYPIVSPMHPFQNPPLRNSMTQTTSWPSQVPWLASSSNPSFDSSSTYTPFSIPEPVKLITPAKELSTPNSSGSKHLSSIPVVHTGGTTILPGTSSLADLKKGTVSTDQVSANSKSRKRKKSSGAEDVVQNLAPVSLVDNFSATVIPNQLPKKASTVEDLSQTSLLALSQADSMSTPVVSSHYATSITVTTPPTFVPKGSNQFFSAVVPTVSVEHHKSGDIGLNRKTSLVYDFCKVEEAKLHAEEAANHATDAVRHCQHLWSQLEIQKNSGLTPDSEIKLASAAVAIAAAASVAKAAAAAAKIASSAAVQARQMVDEAVSYGNTSTIEYDVIRASGPANYFSNTTPVSILRGGDLNNPSNFVISGAREAAKKRVDAATAASWHAENLDAILKAAELAAEAVSHAGKIVTMGDPIPISDLLVAGLDGYWKTSQVASAPISNINKVNPDNNAREVSAKDTDVSGQVVPPVQRELSRAIVDDHILTEESLAASVKRGEKNVRLRKDKDIPGSVITNNTILEKNIESRSNSFSPKYKSSAIIKEGSLVEVFKSRGDNKKAWYLASILSLKDGEAMVSYSNLHSDRGSEPLKEWVSMEAKDGNPAIIRIPHPMSNVQFEGVRKRRRAALKDYDWSAGDKVDAWVHDCWREGIIAENNTKYLTALSVHFPAHGETLVVKLWHLRPTVIWMDDQWMEWCRPGDGRISQGDSPVEKRAKLGSMINETKGKGTVSDVIAFTELGKNLESKLPLSASEKSFKPSAPRTTKPGLLKEGSRGVVFGVPKPGKKRKFMEVSKHYVSDRNAKADVPSDSVKLSMFLISQGSGSKGWKKNVNPDSREKQAADGKVKGLKFGKPPTIPSRTLIRKADSSLLPNTSDASLSEDKSFVSNDDIDMEPGEENVADFGSFPNISGGMIFSSQLLPPENLKKTSTGNTKSERFNKGKLAPAGGKSVKSDTNEKNVSDAAEPRRSNRRIQPTSRLLEGLQSSLTITKLPSSSHDKNLSKVASRGSNGHGR